MKNSVKSVLKVFLDAGSVSVRFGKHLMQLRAERNMTQKAMAEKLQVSESTYANWEQGRREPSLSNLIQIAKILETDMNSLFDIEA